MNKVMTRTRRQHPGGRPPGRHDTRRPGTAPSRPAPGGSAPSRAAAERTAPLTAPRTSPRDDSPVAAHTPRTRPAPDRPTPYRPSPHRPAPLPHGGPAPRPTDVFAELLLAVLSGRRPVHCMLRHTAGRAYDELAWLAERGPLRTRGPRPVVRDIGYYVVRPGAVEAFARIGAGDRLRAMAFRLEQAPDNRWRCTAVELGGPRMPRSYDD
ncbi:Rv3235 family protein [Streptomyces sp. NPDC008313]|uniref:Rv3235 family protein n=1 Tax=Streptomyces sp. NPDC008313 TaxID=3364826 RepID=UPI0036EA8A9C